MLVFLWFGISVFGLLWFSIRCSCQALSLIENLELWVIIFSVLCLHQTELFRFHFGLFVVLFFSVLSYNKYHEHLPCCTLVPDPSYYSSSSTVISIHILNKLLGTIFSANNPKVFVETWDQSVKRAQKVNQICLFYIHCEWQQFLSQCEKSFQCSPLITTTHRCEIEHMSTVLPTEAWWLLRGSVGKIFRIERGTVVIHNRCKKTHKKQTWLTFCVMKRK